MQRKLFQTLKGRAWHKRTLCGKQNHSSTYGRCFSRYAMKILWAPVRHHELGSSNLAAQLSIACRQKLHNPIHNFDEASQSSDQFPSCHSLRRMSNTTQILSNSARIAGARKFVCHVCSITCAVSCVTRSFYPRAAGYMLPGHGHAEPPRRRAAAYSQRL